MCLPNFRFLLFYRLAIGRKTESHTHKHTHTQIYTSENKNIPYQFSPSKDFEKLRSWKYLFCFKNRNLTIFSK